MAKSVKTKKKPSDECEHNWHLAKFQHGFISLVSYSSTFVCDRCGRVKILNNPDATPIDYDFEES